MFKKKVKTTMDTTIQLVRCSIIKYNKNTTPNAGGSMKNLCGNLISIGTSFAFYR